MGIMGHGDIPQNGEMLMSQRQTKQTSWSLLKQSVLSVFANQNPSATKLGKLF
jgi:hypothetical protein